MSVQANNFFIAPRQQTFVYFPIDFRRKRDQKCESPLFAHRAILTIEKQTLRLRIFPSPKAVTLSWVHNVQ